MQDRYNLLIIFLFDNKLIANNIFFDLDLKRR